MHCNEVTLVGNFYLHEFELGYVKQYFLFFSESHIHKLY